MGAINTSRSNIKNTSSIPGGGLVVVEVSTDLQEENGQVVTQGVIDIKVNGKSVVKQEFRVEGKRT